MRNFVFHHPTKIHFGRGALSRIGAEAACLGRKVMLVYGQSSLKRSGLYDAVYSSLDRAGLEVVEHGDVRPNPLLSHVRAGIKLAKEQRVAAMVAVGGGSVIDSAKAIAAGALVDHDVWLFFKGKKGIRQALPIVAAPTVVGAGSETNSGMVLTHDQTRHKFGIGNRLLFPRTALLDPTVTYTVPANHIAYGATDAMAHLLEFYCTSEARYTPLQDRYAEGIIRTIMEGCGNALENPADYQARANLMWSAALALNGLSASGRGRVGLPVHLLGHPLSALHDVPHGASLSAVMPAWLRHQTARDSAPFAALTAGIFPSLGGSQASLAGQGIGRLRDWFKKINCPTRLSELGLNADHIPALVDNTLPLARLWRLRDYTAERIRAILIDAL